MALLTFDQLCVRFTTPDGPVDAVRNLTLSVQAGEAIALVGESGSGKSQSMLAAFGLAAANGQITGKATFDGIDLLTTPPAKRRALLGRDVGFVFQDPLTSLTPHISLVDQVGETLRLHKGLSRRVAQQDAFKLLEQLRFPSPEKRAGDYPHQFSGGQRQRAMIAAALMAGPKLLIADEPTTALDVTVQAEILNLLKTLRQERGMALVFITHDLAVAAQVADRIIVMKSGTIIENGPAHTLLEAPQTSYTRLLANAARVVAPVKSKAQPSMPEVALHVKDVGAEYSRASSWGRTARTIALDHVSFTVNSGDALGIVGESGSGKSTLIRIILGLIKPNSGALNWQGKNLKMPYPHALRRTFQIVHQDPFAALNPRLTLGASIAEPLDIHEPALTKAERTKRIARALEQVGLPPAFANRYPHELSGGQNQRANIARALIAGPSLLACDEAVSALDAQTKAQILDLLAQLQKETGLTLLFVTHDFQAVARLCNRVIVLQHGRCIETGETSKVMAAPEHPYTKSLIAAIPQLSER